MPENRHTLRAADNARLSRATKRGKEPVMAETTTEATGQEAPEGNQSQPAGGSGQFTQEQVNSLLADQKRKMRDQYADYEQLKADSQKLAELEEQSKSELEKAQERASKAEQRLKEMEHAAKMAQDKQEVATEYGLPVDALKDGTREEIEAHAKILQPLIAAKGAPYVPSAGTHPENPGATDAKSAFAQFIDKI